MTCTICHEQEATHQYVGLCIYCPSCSGDADAWARMQDADGPHELPFCSCGERLGDIAHRTCPACDAYFTAYDNYRDRTELERAQ